MSDVRDQVSWRCYRNACVDFAKRKRGSDVRYQMSDVRIERGPYLTSDT
jgi:hypothetical protein